MYCNIVFVENIIRTAHLQITKARNIKLYDLFYDIYSVS